MSLTIAPELSVLNPHSHATCSSCVPHKHEGPHRKFKIMPLLEKVTAIALSIFAYVIAPGGYALSFTAGVLIGIYNHFTNTGRSDCHGERSSCSQGFMEQLTGVKLPAFLGLVANAAVTWCHIDHHPAVFIPIVGLVSGAWAGQSLANATHSLYNRCVPVRIRHQAIAV